MSVETASPRTPQQEVSATEVIVPIEVGRDMVEEINVIGTLAVLKSDIIDYAKSQRFLTRLGQQGSTRDFHMLKSSVDAAGYVSEVSRAVTLGNSLGSRGVSVSVITRHTAEEGLTRPDLNARQGSPRKVMETARGHLVTAGLEGEAADNAVVLLDAAGQRIRLNGKVEVGSVGGELRQLRGSELEALANNPLVALVQNGFNHLLTNSRKGRMAGDVTLPKVV